VGEHVLGRYLLDRQTTVISDALTSYELTWRDSPRLGSRSLVFLASYSGATEDTLAALPSCQLRGAHGRARAAPPEPDGERGVEVIDYASTALYILPLAAVTLFALEIARLTDSPKRAEAEAAIAQRRSCRLCSAGSTATAMQPGWSRPGASLARPR
jgi:glucosamine 6-phosphate synthetase-like amidotransferase/phosphosugar isomerase protein